MDFLFFALTILLMILSIIGCIIPAIPGPILAYGALWLFYITDFNELTMNYMLILGAITTVVFFADYFLPPLITKQFGGSKQAAWGSIVGMLVGMFLTPIGIILGMLIGAFVGEYFFAKTGGVNSLTATIGTFLGFIVGTGLKLALCFYIFYVIIRESVGQVSSLF